ncbi:hypothetical protein B0H14DRAFT_3474697 [Mycena olivaceomarginata]|nr:hypothetical protein B0H14DRAFT_3474697 [Mycena olivaceomarginata]
MSQYLGYLAINASLTGYIPRSYYSANTTPFPIDTTRTPLDLPPALLCGSRSAVLVVAPSTSPRLPLLGTRLRIFVGLHCGALARRPLQARHPRSPRRASSPLSTRCFIAPSPHATLTRIVWRARLRRRYLQGVLPRVGKLEWRVAGIDSTSAASVGAPTTMRLRERGERWTMGAEDASTWSAEGRVDGKHTGGERIMACRCRPPPKSSVLRKTVLICLLARGISCLCPSALHWPKVAHASLDLPWTRSLRANVPAPIIAGRHLPLVHRLVRRVCLTSPHLLVANAPRPRLDTPHLRHIHRRLPFMAASFTQTPRSPLPPQVRRGAEDGKAKRRITVGRCTQLVRGWEAGSPSTARGDDAGWGDARSVSRVQLGYVGVGVPQLHRVRTTRNGETCYCVLAHLSSSATAYLYGGMTGTRRYDHSQRVSQYSPRPPRTPPCLRRPISLRITAPPSLSAAGPRPPRWEKEGEIRDGERSDGGAGETLRCRGARARRKVRGEVGFRM